MELLALLLVTLGLAKRLDADAAKRGCPRSVITCGAPLDAIDLAPDDNYYYFQGAYVYSAHKNTQILTEPRLITKEFATIQHPVVAAYSTGKLIREMFIIDSAPVTNVKIFKFVDGEAVPRQPKWTYSMSQAFGSSELIPKPLTAAMAMLDPKKVVFFGGPQGNDMIVYDYAEKGKSKRDTEATNRIITERAGSKAAITDVTAATMYYDSEKDTTTDFFLFSPTSIVQTTFRQQIIAGPAKVASCAAWAPQVLTPNCAHCGPFEESTTPIPCPTCPPPTEPVVCPEPPTCPTQSPPIVCPTCTTPKPTICTACTTPTPVVCPTPPPPCPAPPPVTPCPFCTTPAPKVCPISPPPLPCTTPAPPAPCPKPPISDCTTTPKPVKPPLIITPDTTTTTTPKPVVIGTDIPKGMARCRDFVQKYRGPGVARSMLNVVRRSNSDTICIGNEKSPSPDKNFLVFKRRNMGNNKWVVEFEGTQVGEGRFVSYKAYVDWSYDSLTLFIYLDMKKGTCSSLPETLRGSLKGVNVQCSRSKPQGEVSLVSGDADYPDDPEIPKLDAVVDDSGAITVMETNTETLWVPAFLQPPPKGWQWIDPYWTSGPPTTAAPSSGSGHVQGGFWMPNPYGFDPPMVFVPNTSG